MSSAHEGAVGFVPHEEVALDDEDRRQLVIGLAQTIAMQAMELPPSRRPASVRRAVIAVRREFEGKYGPAPDLGEAVDRLQALIEAMIQTIDASGGGIGRA